MKIGRFPFSKIVFGSLVAFSASAATEYPFSEVWKLVRENAPEIRAANHELEASRIYEARMSRHWYPRIYAEGRAFSTNDPAQNFMSLLGQRQIAAPDFAPQALNHPGGNFFEHSTLGIDFPLFEGGAKSAVADASAEMAESKSLEEKAVEIQRYAEIAGAYTIALSLQSEREALQKLEEDVEDTLGHYKIGARSNPVGYSGLLGLKNLRNRLKGLLLENSAKASALRDQVRITAKGLPEAWVPKSESVRAFISSHFSHQESGVNGENPPISVRALQVAAQSSEKNKEAERARFFPKFGLFGNGDLYGGSRSSATSYTAGMYLQWDIFSAPNFGAVDQAEHAAAAFQAKADGMRDRAEAERSNARLSAEALEGNLTLLVESASLLEEQSSVAKRLFRNGSINALQFVEVLARRADLLVNRAEAERGLALARTNLFVNSGIDRVPHEE